MPEPRAFPQLLALAKSGDRPALEEVFERCLPGLRAFVRLQMGPQVRAKESCSDLAQTVCREVLADLAGCRADGEAEFRQWLCSLALHKIWNRRRHWAAARRDAARDAEAPDADPDGLLATYSQVATPSRHAAAREEVARIEAAFDRLPEEFRDVIVQARILGLSHVEIAAASGRTEEAVRKLLSRARARLAQLLDQH
jgi:RNA polymerase sigma factor (sigma-70 family)